MFWRRKKAKDKDGGEFRSEFIGILQSKINELGDKYSAEIVFPDGHKITIRRDYNNDRLYY